MPYELRYATIAAANLPKVPGEVVDQIDAGLKALADDPEENSRPTVSPPFVPFGHQCDIRCRDNDGRRYYCVVFFLYSDCGRYLDIHRMQVQAVGHFGLQIEAQPASEIPAHYKEFDIPAKKRQP